MVRNTGFIIEMSGIVEQIIFKGKIKVGTGGSGQHTSQVCTNGGGNNGTKAAFASCE